MRRSFLIRFPRSYNPIFKACVTYGTARRSYQPGSGRLHCAPGAYRMGNGSALYLSQSGSHRVCPHLASQREYDANGVGGSPVGSALRAVGVSHTCFGVDDNNYSHAACRKQPVAGGKRRSIGHTDSGSYVDDPNRSFARLRYDTDHFFGPAPERSGRDYYHDSRCHSLWRA